VRGRERRPAGDDDAAAQGGQTAGAPRAQHNTTQQRNRGGSEAWAGATASRATAWTVPLRRAEEQMAKGAAATASQRGRVNATPRPAMDRPERDPAGSVWSDRHDARRPAR
jgi:hypothetical protein